MPSAAHVVAVVVAVVVEPLPVLMYHAVGSPMPSALTDLTVDPSLLTEHLAALTDDGWALLGLTEALAAHAAGRRVVGLTFDDGYRDFEGAVPVLAAAGARATLYVPTRAIGHTASWLPGAAGELPLLDVAGLVAVADAGVEVGSHGAVHVPMDVLPGAEAGRHLTESRRVLADLVGQPVASFCYPHGYHSAALRRRVAAAGYANACAIGHRLDRGDDALAVQRLMATPDHTGADLQRLVADGSSPWRPALKRAATPAWRLARRTAARTGRTWT